MTNAPMMAYLITEGSYSDYGVVRVYLDKNEAERVVEAHNKVHVHSWNEWQVEPHPIGPDAPFDGEVFVASWSRRPRRVAWGEGHEVLEPPREVWSWDEEGHDVEWWTGDDPGKATIWSVAGLMRDGSIPPDVDDRWLSISVRGTSKEHVAKALQDKVAWVKARIAGVTD